MENSRDRRRGGKARLAHIGGEQSRRRYDDHWLEHTLPCLYESAVEEPVPKEFLDLVSRIPDVPRGTSENAQRRAQNAERVRQNIGSLHRLLNFQEDKTAGQRIAKLVKGRVPAESREPARSGRGTDSSDRARAWRRKAKECRAAAETMKTEAARSSLLQLARDYEALAESWEKASQQSGKLEQGAG